MEARDNECSDITWAICESIPHPRQLNMAAFITQSARMELVGWSFPSLEL